MKLISMAFVILWGTIGFTKGEFIPSSDIPKAEDSKEGPAKGKYSDAEIEDFLKHVKKVRPSLYKLINARWQKELAERKNSSASKRKNASIKPDKSLRSPASSSTDNH